MIKTILITVILGALFFAVGYMTGGEHERKKQQIEMMKHERDWRL